MKKIKLMKTSASLTGLGLLLWVVGCGQPGHQETPEAQESPVETEVSAGPAQATTPAATIPADAPVLAEVYPTLSNGILRRARLADLPEGTVLQSEGLALTVQDLRKQLNQLPSEQRKEMEKHAFMLIEQMATIELIKIAARQRIDNPDLGEEQLLQAYFEELTKDVAPSDAEIESFYNDNRQLVGNAPLERVKPQIRQHLQQQKEQEVIERHLAGLGDSVTIALAADWVAEQAELALDNPVEIARASGKPTFVNFGAKGCVPCDRMEPVRAELASEYEEQLNIVFVHVNRDQLLASRYGVRGIPHLIFYDSKGQPIHEHTGFMPKEEIESWLSKIGVEIKG